MTAGPGKKARETGALTRKGSQGQNQVPEDWKDCLFFSFPAHESSGISLKGRGEGMCSLDFVNYTPDLSPPPGGENKKPSPALSANKW